MKAVNYCCVQQRAVGRWNLSDDVNTEQTRGFIASRTSITNVFADTIGTVGETKKRPVPNPGTAPVEGLWTRGREREGVGTSFSVRGDKTCAMLGLEHDV